MKMLKKIILMLFVFGCCVMIAGLSVVLTDRLQRSQDYKTLRAFVNQATQLKVIRNDSAQDWRTLCEPEGSGLIHCPSLLYQVDKNTCMAIMRSYVASDKDFCAGTAVVDYQGRSIEIDFGGIYPAPVGAEHAQFIQVIMNERNLLSDIRPF